MKIRFAIVVRDVKVVTQSVSGRVEQILLNVLTYLLYTHKNNIIS